MENSIPFCVYSEIAQFPSWIIYFGSLCTGLHCGRFGHHWPPFANANAAISWAIQPLRGHSSSQVCTSYYLESCNSWSHGGIVDTRGLLAITIAEIFKFH